MKNLRTEEKWIDDCQQRFMQIRIRTKDYLKVRSQGQFENETNPEADLVPNQTETTVSDNGNKIYPTKVNYHPTKINSHPTKVKAHPTKVNPHPTKVNSHPTKVNPIPTSIEEHNSPSSSDGAQSISNVQPVCGFKMEKSKILRFSGDIIQYSTYRDDFKHAIESRYSKRDAMT